MIRRKVKFTPAQSSWQPTRKELKALKERTFTKNLKRVDEIWPYLSEKYSEVVAVNDPYSTPPISLTYSELASFIDHAASALKSFNIGKGEVVALFAENSPKWLIADQAIMRVGAANAVRGISAPKDELKYILRHSQSVALFIQSSDVLESLDLSSEEKNQIKLIVQLDGKSSDSNILDWDTLIDVGQQNKFTDNINNQSNNLSDEIATILYTSGTTGRPKGVPLTHKNLLHQIKSLVCVANPNPGSAVLSVLPIWHSYERSAEYYFFSCGCTQTYTTIKNLKNDLPRVKPVIMATVPRLWEAIYLGFNDAIKTMPKFRRRLIEMSVKNSSSYKFSLRKLKNNLIYHSSIKSRFFSLLNLFMRMPLHFLSARILWPKVKKQLCGGNLQFPISGGGAISSHVDLFFESIGIELLVGYGLTETSPVVSCRRTWKNIRGSAGTPLPETYLKVVDPDSKITLGVMEKGLIFAKGPQVMNGYIKNEEETKKVLDPDGWFNTGDLGFIKRDGTLIITGRKKDTIVLSSGENIEPGPLEEALLGIKLIEQVMIVGQDEKNLGALIVLNLDEAQKFMIKGGSSLEDNPANFFENESFKNFLRSEINKSLKSRNNSRREERVFGIAFVEKFTIDNGLLTQTLKQRRDKIRERDRAIISSIFHT